LGTVCLLGVVGERLDSAGVNPPTRPSSDPSGCCGGHRCVSLGVEGDGGASPGGAWSFVSGYKRPEVLGVLACGTISARPCGVAQRGALD